MRRGSKKPCVSKLAGVGLPHVMIPLPVLHLINSSDPASTKLVLTKPIKFSNHNTIKGFYSTAENRPVSTNCSAWHAKVDWNASKPWHGWVNACVHAAIARLVLNHNRVATSRQFRCHRTALHTSRIHGCVVLQNQGFRPTACSFKNNISVYFLIIII